MNDQLRYAHKCDAELAALSGGGDTRAFDEIAARYARFASRVASRVVSNAAIVEEIVQEAMVRAWTQSGRFDSRRARFATWLYRIVVNLCIDHRRRIQPEAIPEDFEIIDPGVSADEMLEIDERRRALGVALGGLPERQRAALALVYEKGLSGADAGRQLGLSAKAVERLLARGRASLRVRLQLGEKSIT
ncbi:MAG TPA: sigma-70 family RNA polymerase sigma factor [Steroidobacteraceae bacterium]|jgi:RNA polymerase sigma-70 factor (ECF subfamily)